VTELETIRVDEAAGALDCPKADGVVHLLLLGAEITSTDAGGKPAWSYAGGRPPAGPG
jgi:hypothetical protein